MPRIKTSANEPLDFCSDCFPDQTEAEVAFGNVDVDTDNCFEHRAEHPPYEGTNTRCHYCKALLRELDD